MGCLEEALGRFRGVFGAEALVDILSADDRAITARFYGNMCYTCGTVDYFEDFAGMYSECAGEEWTVESYEQSSDGSYIVVFKPKRDVKAKRRHIRIVVEGKEIDYTLEIPLGSAADDPPSRERA
ncbi:hypothetical protein [Thermoproteus tenax]|uniref:Uncharacterized protein n=1 Tax=Thermoproteus tenax (strain ATCC 35583 / DSM 2078 / JCM 9277 / NBRC 100435 / Kra 1) TaxID=768679 RepID=G4RN77_THETK|nr:hypothetical protein [Thermoproteus tenax]CCC81021.1 hypothetical protein TTX_0346 [Thermoproteus tenax Kra 1]